MARAARRHSAAGRRVGVLSFYCVLSGLGRHLFFRQPFFHFADTAIHSWPQRSARARCRAVSQPTRSRCRCLRSSRGLHALERGVYVSVGRAPDSSPWADFLERDDPQPIQRCAAPVGRALGELSFQSSRFNAPNRRPRHRPNEKTTRAVNLVVSRLAEVEASGLPGSCSVATPLDRPRRQSRRPFAAQDKDRRTPERRSARVAKNSGNLIGIPPALSQMLLRLILWLRLPRPRDPPHRSTCLPP